MTKKLSAVQKLINRYDRSTGNFADNLREMSAYDIMQAHGLTREEAQKVVDHMANENTYNGPTKPLRNHSLGVASPIKNGRTPYVIKVRCVLNGADTTRLLFLKRAGDAGEVMKKYVPAHERNHLRVVGQRVATQEEVAAHRARQQENDPTMGKGLGSCEDCGIAFRPDPDHHCEACGQLV